MDGTMSLIEADFSLFGGDLLFPPPVSFEEAVTGSQDGLKIIPKSDHFEWQNQEDSLSHDVLSVEAASGGLLQDWLDTPVDLLNLFTEDNKLSADSSSIGGFNLPIDDVKTDTPGLEALKSLTEEIALQLSTEAVIAPQVCATPGGIDLSGPATGDVYDTGLGLLELLTATVEASCGGLSGIADLDLMPIDTSSPILSPMSPEDVETILSSGPTSPVSCTTETSLQSFVSPDNSLIDFSIMEEEEENSVSEDLVQLVQMVRHPDDSLPEPTIEARVNKSRAGPYERKEKKDRQDSLKPTGIVKTIEKKQRKKQQNKDAATRYRQKKKMEQETVTHELTALETHNGNLKDRVDRMTKEVQYLKNLLVEVQKARIKREKSE